MNLRPDASAGLPLAVACCGLSATACYFSLGLGEHWWLAWFAPVPVLWFALGCATSRGAFLAAWAAMALGLTSLLTAYGGLLPAGVLAAAIAGPAALFGLGALGARCLYRTRGPLAAAAGFAVIWTAGDFLVSFNRGGGSISTPAAAEVAAPALIQVASLVGFPGITFLLGLVAAALATSLRARTARPLLVAAIAFTGNAAFGLIAMTAAPTGHLRVALVESDAAYVDRHKEDSTAALRALADYAAVIAPLRGTGTGLILLPENIARIAPGWQPQAWAQLSAVAESTGGTVVAGVSAFEDGAWRNLSWAFAPGSTAPASYAKRRMIPGVESPDYAPGSGPAILPGGVGLEICKDMDFHAMIRRDATATRPQAWAVPAWDFDRDGWSHARIAILRSVENGVPMVRTARDGQLTVNDRFGRLLVRTASRDGFSVVTVDLPLSGRGGATVYDRIGDAFGWLSVAVSAGLALACVRRRSLNP